MQKVLILGNGRLTDFYQSGAPLKAEERSHKSTALEEPAERPKSEMIIA